MGVRKRRKTKQTQRENSFCVCSSPHQEVQSVLILLQRLVCPITAFPLSVFRFWLVLTSLFFFLHFVVCCSIVLFTSLLHQHQERTKSSFFSGNPLKCGRSSRGFNKQKPSKGFWSFTSTDLFLKFETAITLPPGGGRVSDTSAQGIAAKYLTAQRWSWRLRPPWKQFSRKKNKKNTLFTACRKWLFSVDFFFYMCIFFTTRGLEAAVHCLRALNNRNGRAAMQ